LNPLKSKQKFRQRYFFRQIIDFKVKSSKIITKPKTDEIVENLRHLRLRRGEKLRALDEVGSVEENQATLVFFQDLGRQLARDQQAAKS
jgi:hypothetical protein